MHDQFLLYAKWDEERERFFVDVAEVVIWPPPLGIRVICRIDREDKDLMLEWAISKARCGWGPEKMRAACERRFRGG